MTPRALALALVICSLPAVALGQAPKKKSEGALGFGSNSRDPIQIDADRLEVFNKEQRAVYSGNVVAVQGETTIKAATMIVFFDRGEKKGEGDKPQAGSGGPDGSSLKRVEAKGGVTIISRDQVATGQTGEFDRVNNKMILTGNVALSQGENVTKGEKLVYDTETGVAVVEAARGKRVQGIFVPGGEEGGKGDGKKPDKKGEGKPRS